jgi:hypothetical protein
LHSIENETSINSKAYLFAAPDGNTQTKAILCRDEIKIIQRSPDNKWINIGYINSKGRRLLPGLRLNL